MMGLFVARISRGRTIRELIVAELVWGSLGCWVFLAVWGGYALDLQISGALDVSAILSAGGIPATVLAILNTMPMSQLAIVVFIVLCFIFLATTLDSAAYVLASVTSHKLSGYQEPKRWIRIMWALILAAVGIVLIQLGGLKPVQTSTIVVALPLIPVLVILMLSLLRWLKEDFGEQTQPGPVVWLEESSERMLDPRARRQVDFDEALRALDLCNVIAGPHSVSYLARFGAEAIKLDPSTPSYDCWNTVIFGISHRRGKRSILTDITSSEGRIIFKKLVKSVDVIVWNAPDRQVKNRGLDLEILEKLNPDAIFCKLDGFSGPRPGPRSGYPVPETQDRTHRTASHLPVGTRQIGTNAFLL